MGQRCFPARAMVGDERKRRNRLIVVCVLDNSLSLMWSMLPPRRESMPSHSGLLQMRSMACFQRSGWLAVSATDWRDFRSPPRL